jgi:predicted TIM-barrel fold metal-dependent hydrolase
MKLGGLLMRLVAFDYTTVTKPPSSKELTAMWAPSIETCIELFGVGRCMFESNYPVEKMGTGYAALWNAFKRVTAAASTAEKIALYKNVAAKVYRLEGF